MKGYSYKFMDCFLEPRGFGDLENYQCSKTIANEEDGISVTFFVKNEDDKLQFKYKVLGCGTIIATCCAIYDLYFQKTKNECLNANMTDIINYLEGIPEEKLRCAYYALEAFLNAVSYC